MRLWPLLLLTSCQGPDRWSTSVARSDGEIDGYGRHTYDTEATTLEVGISGPLWSAPAPRPAPPPAIEFSKPKPVPAEEGSIPWTELALILGGAAGLKGTEMGYRRVRRRTKTA